MRRSCLRYLSCKFRTSAGESVKAGGTMVSYSEMLPRQQARWIPYSYRSSQRHLGQSERRDPGVGGLAIRPSTSRIPRAATRRQPARHCGLPSRHLYWPSLRRAVRPYGPYLQARSVAVVGAVQLLWDCAGNLEGGGGAGRQEVGAVGGAESTEPRGPFAASIKASLNT
jgi:hypothetical protein